MLIVFIAISFMVACWWESMLKKNNKREVKNGRMRRKKPTREKS